MKFNSILNAYQNFGLSPLFLHFSRTKFRAPVMPFSRVLKFLHEYFIAIFSWNLILHSMHIEIFIWDHFLHFSRSNLGHFVMTISTYANLCIISSRSINFVWLHKEKGFHFSTNDFATSNSRGIQPEFFLIVTFFSSGG